MTQATERPDLDIQCAKARPWVRQFVEDNEDGRPWGYAIYEDPVVDSEKMERGMSRISLLLRIAQVAVYGGDHREFPKFQFEILDWPGETDEGPGAEQDDANSSGEKPPVGPAHSEAVGKAAPEQKLPETEVKIEKPKNQDLEPTSVMTLSKQAAQQQSNNCIDPEAIAEDTKHNYDFDDADIDLVRDFPILREHFKWVCHQRKRLGAGQPQNIDRSGIPLGLLRKVFILLDEDSIDSILGNPPIVDNAWVWAIDPNYTGDENVASMTKDGLRDEYYGYMRVRVQQLVNNFWAAVYQDERPLFELWESAKQSRNCAFASVDPLEAQQCRVSMDVGSSLRAT